jgi:hypothetical protein
VPFSSSTAAFHGSEWNTMGLQHNGESLVGKETGHPQFEQTTKIMVNWISLLRPKRSLNEHPFDNRGDRHH